MTTTEAHRVLSSIDGAEPIGLEELVARASLQTRVDRKYLLPVAAAETVLAQLASTGPLRALELGSRRTFGYESQYLDTSDLAGYLSAARGRRRRFKVRRRTYLDTGDSFLEVKTRGVRGATVKQRIPCDPTAAMTGTQHRFVDSVLRVAGIDGPTGAGLVPTLATGYRRSTLFLPSSASRVTVDTDLAFCLPDGRSTTLSGVAVVETKSGSAASAADRALWQHGHRPCRISKYATGLAALRPELPANKWHPVLRRFFPALPCPPSSPNGSSS